MKILILGASYGSLLSTKLLMAGHDVTLVCRDKTATLINKEGSVVRLTLRGENETRLLKSGDFRGKLNASTPDKARPEDYDLIALAMQEPQYGEAHVKALMGRIAASGCPCLSIMNMPPLPYLQRIEGLVDGGLEHCYTDANVWDGFDAGNVTLCSPDPQAFRPPEELPNFLHVGLPTNFKAAEFAKSEHNIVLRQLEADIADVRLEGYDVPVKLRVHQSLFVPLAKWSMLLTGNYRCVTLNGTQSIHEAVHGNISQSKEIYHWVDKVARKLGADAKDQVPFEKYAKAAENLIKPSSAARAIQGGAIQIERVDLLVQAIGNKLGLSLELVNETVDVINKRLDANN